MTALVTPHLETASPPAPSWRAGVLALLRRDALGGRRSPAALLLDLAFGSANLGVFFFISRVLRRPDAAAVTAAGGYFSFVAVGLAYLTVVQAASATVAREVRDGQLTGTLEMIVLQPIARPALAVGLVAYPYLFASVRAIVYLAVATAFGLDVARANWLGVVVVFVVGILALTTIGILLAGIVIVLNRGDIVARVAIVALGFASGVYFPTSELPGPLAGIARVLPTTLALQSLRAAFAGQSWAPETGLLVLVTAALVPVALCFFTLALRLAIQRGDLTRG